MRFTPLRAAFVCAALALTTTACGSVGEDSSSDDSAGQENGQSGPIKVGLVIPQSGVYAPLGEDMKAGWDLWLEQHGNKLGGREVETVVVDEGEGPDTGVPAVQKVLQQDRVDTVVGIVNSATALGAVETIDAAKKVLVVANAGADALTGSSKYIWRTSFTNGQVAYSVGKHVAGTPEGKKGVYAMAADYAAGEEAIAGFKKGFEEGGGKLVGEAKTPFGTTQDFQPFLAKARSAKPGRRLCVLRGCRGRVLRQAVQGIRPVRQRPALRLRLPHRRRRVDGAGRRRRGGQDRSALRDGAREPGQQELHRGLSGQDRQAAHRLRGAGVGCSGGARQGRQGGGRTRR